MNFSLKTTQIKFLFVVPLNQVLGDGLASVHGRQMECRLPFVVLMVDGPARGDEALLDDAFDQREHSTLDRLQEKSGAGLTHRRVEVRTLFEDAQSFGFQLLFGTLRGHGDTDLVGVDQN